MSIKFRSWNESQNRFFYFKDGEYYLYDTCRKEDVIYSDLFDWNNAEQYTGLKDKNDIEMYVGDVAKNANDILLEIYFDDSVLQFRQRVCNRKNVESLGFTWQKNPTNLSLNYNWLIVIGNIHENKELLDV